MSQILNKALQIDLQAVSDKRNAPLRSSEELAGIVTEFASSTGWIERVRLRVEQRWYERLYHGPDYDIWAISWLPGTVHRLP